MSIGSWRDASGTRDLEGMSVEAVDGSAGKVDRVIEREGSEFLLIDTGPWILGKTVMLPVTVIAGVDAERNVVSIQLTKAQVKDSPEPEVKASEPAPDLDTPEPESPQGTYELETPPESPVSPGRAGTSDVAFHEEPAEEVTALEPAARDDRQDVGAAAWPDMDRAGAEQPSDEEPARASEHGTELPMPPSGAQLEQSRPEPGPEPAKPMADRAEPSPKAADRKRKTEDRRAPRRSVATAPIARYESLTAAAVIARLRELTQRELAQVERHERSHQNRQTVLGRIESLREEQPWRGYDEQTVREVAKKLAKRDADKVRAVRDYERRHRDRTGIMEAARRKLDKA